MGQAAYDMNAVRRRRAPQTRKNVPLRVEKGGKRRLTPFQAAMQHAIQLISVALMVGFAVSLLWSEAQLVELNDQIQDAKAQLVSEQSQYTYYNSALNSKTNITSVEALIIFLRDPEGQAEAPAAAAVGVLIAGLHIAAGFRQRGIQRNAGCVVILAFQRQVGRVDDLAALRGVSTLPGALQLPAGQHRRAGIRAACGGAALVHGIVGHGRGAGHGIRRNRVFHAETGGLPGRKCGRAGRFGPSHPDDSQMEHGSRTTCHHAERRTGSQPFPHTTAGEVERLFVGRHFRLFPRDGFCSRSQDGLLALHGQQLCL